MTRPTLIDSGFMVSDVVPDKDGIGAFGAFALMVDALYRSGTRLSAYLDLIYQKYIMKFHVWSVLMNSRRYGFSCTYNSYYFCHDPIAISTIFNEIRYGSQQNDDGLNRRPWPAIGLEKSLNYPCEVDQQYRIVHVRDLTVGYDSRHGPQFTPSLPTSSSSQMITFYIESMGDGPKCEAVLTLRTSGTEPKIKFYSEAFGSLSVQEQVRDWLTTMVQCLMRHLLQPQRFGLKAKQ
jgi:phosphomannomutase